MGGKRLLEHHRSLSAFLDANAQRHFLLLLLFPSYCGVRIVDFKSSRGLILLKGIKGLSSNNRESMLASFE